MSIGKRHRRLCQKIFGLFCKLPGIILGPIAELGFRNVLTLSDDSPISFIAGRWISMTIVVMIVLALYYSLKPKKWEEKPAGADGEPSNQDDSIETKQS